MNNSDIPSNYRGRYFTYISNTYDVNIHVDAGTILIQEIEDSITYFELAVKYLFNKQEKFLRFRPHNGVMLMELGSVVDNHGNHLDDSKQFALPEFVRFPTEEEFNWYEQLCGV